MKQDSGHERAFVGVAPDSFTEVMGRLCWEFSYETFPDVKIKGSMEIRTVSAARQLCEALNCEFGEGSHWIEALNHTHEEHIAAIALEFFGTQKRSGECRDAEAARDQE